MLNLFRRHLRSCKNFGKRTKGKCPSQPPCPIYIEGTDGQRRRVKPQGLVDPRTGSAVRDWAQACEVVRDLETPTPEIKPEAHKVTVDTAFTEFRQLKSKTGVDNQRKIRLVTERLKEFLRAQKVQHIAEVKLPILAAFRATWTAGAMTQRRDQGILREFFAFCVDSEYMARNPASSLDAIKVNRPKTDPFTIDEQLAIMRALDGLTDEYGRRRTPVALQTKAFVLLMRYTGMAIGDVAKLRKDDVDGCRIRTYRKKTGEEVFAKVPQFVIDTLNMAPHDSEEYFFWTGRGLIHTRTSKWGDRLQRLFVVAGVRVEERLKQRRSGGVLKSVPELARVSRATPHMFRHTFARDFLAGGGSMTELAELLGNSPAICEKHYSKWDKRRQDRLEQNIDAMRSNDPITKLLMESIANGSEQSRMII